MSEHDSWHRRQGADEEPQGFEDADNLHGAFVPDVKAKDGYLWRPVGN